MHNCKPLFINERLPKDDIEIKRDCDKLGLVITTHNCAVKPFFRAENVNIFSQAVHSKQAGRDLAVKAVKKALGTMILDKPEKEVEAVLYLA